MSQHASNQMEERKICSVTEARIDIVSNYKKKNHARRIY